MTTTTPSRAIPAAPGTFSFTPLRIALFLVYVATAVFLATHSHAVRTTEAHLARPLLDLVIDEVRHRPGSEYIVYSAYHSPYWRALRVTIDCSSVLVVVPMLVAGGCMSLVRRFSAWRAAGAMAAAALALVVINLLRIAMVGIAAWRFGKDGYEISHRIVGSGLVIAASVTAFVLAFRIVAKHARQNEEP